MIDQPTLDGLERARAPRRRSLGFKGQYVDAILAGAKTTSIRAESNRLPEPGDEIGLRCRYDLPPFARAVCTGNVPLTLRQITTKIARADGFGSARELRAALAAHHPGQRTFRVISFELLPAVT